MKNQAFSENGNSKINSYLPFFVALVVVMLIKAFTMAGMGSLFLKAQMWAETATNFYYHARYGSFWENLKQIDYIYLPLLPRLWALFSRCFHFPSEWLPYYFQIFGLVVIAGCCASIFLPVFRPLFPRKWERIILITGVLFLRDYELHTFINASYFLTIPMTCFFLRLNQDQELPMDLKTYGLGILIVSIGILSKIIFLAFVPVCLYFGFHFVNRQKWVKLLGVLILLLCSAVQFYVVLSSLKLVFQNHESAVPLTSVLSPPFLAKYFSGLYSIFYYSFASRLFHPLISLFILLGSLIFLLKNVTRKYFIFLLFFMVSIYTFNFILVWRGVAHFLEISDRGLVPFYHDGRFWIVSVMVFYICILLAIFSKIGRAHV